jgi:hypothetical protein
VDAPLISLTETPVVDVRAAWVLYVGDDEPRRVPAEVRQAGQHVRHVVVCGLFGVEFWWQASPDGDQWYFVQQSG